MIFTYRNTTRGFALHLTLLFHTAFGQESFISGGVTYVRGQNGFFSAASSPKNNSYGFANSSNYSQGHKHYSRNIKSVFQRHGEHLDWEKVKATVGITQECSFRTIDKKTNGYLGEVKGRDSGVVDDDGERYVFQRIFGNMVLRFTFDRVTLNDGLTPFCFFELFIRDKNNTLDPEGYIVQNNGDLLDIAPDRFVFDKIGQKEFDALDERVFSGSGCYACHPSASLDLDYKFTNAFWSEEIDSSAYEDDKSQGR